MDFESELVENDVEIMAKDMRTQPTSLSSILESQNLDVRALVSRPITSTKCDIGPNRGNIGPKSK